MRAHRRRRGLRSVSRGELDALVAGVDPALAEVALVAGISAAASDDWTAAAWLLERQHPGRWGLPPLREQLELGSGEPL
jgi:hypothetical protein